ncbi:hypothetical protein K1719_029975 [Acacia pycnantha]|nr:hypothetical protein K1719_029975 [Acacia pycnantha]
MLANNSLTPEPFPAPIMALSRPTREKEDPPELQIRTRRWCHCRRRRYWNRTGTSARSAIGGFKGTRTCRCTAGGTRCRGSSSRGDAGGEEARAHLPRAHVPAPRPRHALGDLVGIKKHFRRKHSNHKQWLSATTTPPSPRIELKQIWEQILRWRPRRWFQHWLWVCGYKSLRRNPAGEL